MPGTEEHRIGLRFKRGDAGTLRRLADRCKAGELGAEALETFSAAADAAQTGEPLIVICSTPMEAAMMAAGYSRFGITPPSIESLSGDSSGARNPGPTRT